MAMTARYKSTCKNCFRVDSTGAQAGIILPGEQLTWSRRGEKGIWHTECYWKLRESRGYNSQAQSDSNMGARGLNKAREEARSDRDAMQLSDLRGELSDVRGTAREALLKATAAQSTAVSASETVKDLRQTITLGLADITTDIKELRRKVDNVQTVTVKYVPREGETKELGLQHKMFPALLRKCMARDTSGNALNIWLTGAAGTGKTRAAQEAAKALGLPFRYTGSIDTQYALTGFVNAAGQVVSTEFRKAYTEGGVFLFDEVDGSSPNATLAFNAALANGYACFPDGNFERHADCVVIAAANTWGLGATHDYVGRNKLDAAFLDRFVFQDWPIDEALEMATVGNSDWVRRVQQVRAAVVKAGIKVLVTPRASYFGAAMLAAGVDQDEVERATLRKGMSDAQWEMVSCR